MKQRAGSDRVMFLYWGRRGALTRFTLELGRFAVAYPGLRASVSVSRQNEGFHVFSELGDALFPVDTFNSEIGAIASPWRISRLRRSFIDRMVQDRTNVCIALMSHVWMPFMVPAIRDAGIRFVTIIHDAEPHPGDRTLFARRLGAKAIRDSDLVFTLSNYVASRLVELDLVAPSKVVALHHPDLHYGPSMDARLTTPGEPWRILFLGRILRYKALPVFLDMISILREEGLPVEFGVFGEGSLGTSAERLSAMGAEVVNRWLGEEEIGPILQRYNLVVLSHNEASQSGVAAAALGCGIPLVASPVGGLVEQIEDGRTGILAEGADARSLANAVKRIHATNGLYAQLCDNIVASRHTRSMSKFVKDCVRHTSDGCG